MLCTLLSVGVAVAVVSPDLQALFDSLALPNGFSIELFASGLNQPRAMDLSPNGTLFVGSLNNSVYAIRDGVTHVVATNLSAPNGVAFHAASGDLYIGTLDAVLVVKNVEANLSAVHVPTVANAHFFDAASVYPMADWHGLRYLRVRGDELFMTVGSPCNTPADPADANATCKCFWPGHGCSYPADKVDYLGSLLKFPLPGLNNITRVAHGIRNSVGVTWTPNGDLWFTDNGRDQWDLVVDGNDTMRGHSSRPPDELNVVRRNSTPDQHYGFPQCFGVDLIDHQFNSHNSCELFVGAVQPLGAHVASLGLRYYNGSMFPPTFANSLIIAEHGSWDADPPTGYRLSIVKLDADFKPVSYEPFVTGFLLTATGMDANAWARVADVQVLDDGSVLVTNDKRGEIYRITYGTKTSPLLFEIGIGALVFLGLACVGIAIHTIRTRSTAAAKVQYSKI
jgi:glucose/arabinose dehydrogenase